MEKIKSPEPNKPNLEKIRQTIAENEQKIEAELQRTDNTWPACFRSRLTIISGRFYFAQRDKEINENTYKQALHIINDLDVKSRELENNLLEKQKQELLDELGHILDII